MAVMMFTPFSRNQQLQSDVSPDAKTESDRGQLEFETDTVVVAQYPTTRVRHMWSSYKR